MLSIFFKAAGQDQKRLQTSTKRACQAIPGHSSDQGSCSKFQHTEIGLCTQVGLSDLVPHFRQIRSGGDSDGTSRTTSIFWGSTRASQTGWEDCSSDSHREKALLLAGSNDNSSRGDRTNRRDRSPRGEYEQHGSALAPVPSRAGHGGEEF
jgi:hypothetical protein